ncbi:MAG: carbon-nitrogen family hydrolase, partial [Blastocatellia bacterium]|nr:carbon-nitrogen family hydrolase [Blastocatellia bacterium]
MIGIQPDSVWENKSATHARVSALLAKTKPQPGTLVVLPEMFATGFSMNVAGIDDSETRETQDFLARTAAEYRIYLLGGLVAKHPNGRGINQSVVYAPDGGELARYAKIHPFTLGGESDNYAAGEGLCLFDLEEFRVAMFICYDLRFPEIFREAVRRGANLYTVIASWPVAREDHWVTLLRARAIENQAYVIGVNRFGSDPKFFHPGHSLIVHPSGKVLAEGEREECAIGAE